MPEAKRPGRGGKSEEVPASLPERRGGREEGRGGGEGSNSALALINSKCCSDMLPLTRVVTQGLSGANERII